MYQSPFKKVRKTEKGASLKRWFKEEWIDVRIAVLKNVYQVKRQRLHRKCLLLKKVKK
jgi:hypothetical protein